MSKYCQLLLLRLSLAFLWILSGLTSLFWGRKIGDEVLVQAGIKDFSADILIIAGSALDLLLGIWLLVGIQLYHSLRLQFIVIVIYSVLLTIIDASFWLHPFGPLAKNIPLLVLLLLGMSLLRERGNHR